MTLEVGNSVKERRKTYQMLAMWRTGFLYLQEHIPRRSQMELDDGYTFHKPCTGTTIDCSTE